jgi:hypothetical protein
VAVTLACVIAASVFLMTLELRDALRARRLARRSSVDADSVAWASAATISKAMQIELIYRETYTNVARSAKQAGADDTWVAQFLEAARAGYSEYDARVTKRIHRRMSSACVASVSTTLNCYPDLFKQLRELDGDIRKLAIKLVCDTAKASGWTS